MTETPGSDVVSNNADFGRLLTVSTDAERTAEVPESLLPSVMGTVWSELRRGTAIPLPTSYGSATVADHAVASVLAHALDMLDDLRVNSCAVSLGRTPGTITVQLAIALAYGSDVLEACDAVRTAIRNATHEQFGLVAAPVDVAIVDVFVGAA